MLPRHRRGCGNTPLVAIDTKLQLGSAHVGKEGKVQASRDSEGPWMILVRLVVAYRSSTSKCILLYPCD